MVKQQRSKVQSMGLKTVVDVNIFLDNLFKLAEITNISMQHDQGELEESPTHLSKEGYSASDVKDGHILP